MGNKGKGWSNEDHHKAAKKEGEQYLQSSNYKEFKREPYDPSKEKVTSQVGRLLLGGSGHYLHVDLTRYDGGTEKVALKKVRKDGSTIFVGNLWRGQAEELSSLMAQAAKMLAETERLDGLARDKMAKERRTVEVVRKIIR